MTASGASPAAEDPARRTDRLRRMMEPYRSPRHDVVAMALRRGESEILHAGDAAAADPGELIFEIGSITKVFTAILLRVLAEEGRLDPLAPLREMSAELRGVPDWITPESLTSHTSGLPRIHVPVWKALIVPLPDDPYAAFSREDLLDWIGAWSRGARRPKRRHAYSNLGVGLLGEAMAMREGRPFTRLLEEKVLRPLGLRDTACRLSESQSRRFVRPRNTKGDPVTPWTFDAMAAAGCLRSTAGDLARFSARVMSALEAPETALDRAISRSVDPVLGLDRGGSADHSAQCSGWFSTRPDETGPRILHHDGGTAGSTCAIYICPERATAAAILSNNGVAASIWASLKLARSNPIRRAEELLVASRP